MFKIYGGGTAFRQWDQGYVLTNDCMNVGDEVVFRNSTGKTIPVNAREDGGAVVVDVPNELLMDCSNIVVELGQGNGRHHECFTTFEVERCDKPSGYVCKPNEYRAPTNAPDWNQNDPSGVGYIKNRTHWVETVTTRDISVEFPEAGESVSGLFSLDLVEGETYEVTWDGVLYSCAAYIVNGPNTPSIGNAEVVNASGGGNGEPFFCTVYQGSVMLFASTAGTHTISMPHFEEYEAKKIHKLDGKYLPDGIGYFGVEMASYVCDGEQIPLYGFPVFAAGNTVVITVDGVEQSFVALENEFGWPYFGDSNIYDNPKYGWNVFVGDFYENDGTIRKSAFAESIETHTFSYPAEVVHKIDPKCMPDIVLTSPNGTKFTLRVTNDGEIYAYNPDAV